jgi:D-beta-D-heptose 7-phosphate kinase/D-beta-D-heptose 1-phosphate adenosyltransferase
MSAELLKLVDRLGAPRMLVVGDVMLDRYIWGDAARISQEAPVLLLQADRREERLGGASSVATLLRALGANVTLAGVIGSDTGGDQIKTMLSDLQVDSTPLTTDGARPSTVKERYIGRAQHRHPQQILRVDYEVRLPIVGDVERNLIRQISAAIRHCDAVLISDYDKGVCTPTVLAETIRVARSQNKPVLADPIRGNDYGKYSGCHAITPNRLEAGLATAITINGTSSALVAAERLMRELKLDAAIVTLDKDGMALADRTGRRTVFATRPRQVYDITGAGDMVLAMLGLALAAGIDYPDAIRLANIAGGLEVEKIGVAPITREEIVADIRRVQPSDEGELSKTCDVDVLLPELLRRRGAGQRVVFTNGCFDVLHAGHVQYLAEAKAQGEILVVGLNNDSSVRLLKGAGRPINPVSARAAVLSALHAVDFIVAFDSSTPAELIARIRPDVLVKGADYRKPEIVGAEFVESYGGRVHIAQLRDGFSTTNIVKQLKAA